MSSTPQEDVTRILAAASSGDPDAADRLLPIVYDELRDLAEGYLRRERADHTLQATALVHEAYLKMVGQTSASFNDRQHFFAIAATAMRRILVNHAKGKKRIKRGGGQRAMALDEAAAVFDDRAIDLVALDEALDRLTQMDPVQSRLVELRFFGGLSAEDAAELLDMSLRTAHREWAAARAWLRGEILKGDNADA